MLNLSLGYEVPCQDVGVPFKGVEVPSQVVRVSIQGRGVYYRVLGCSFRVWKYLLGIVKKTLFSSFSGKT